MSDKSRITSIVVAKTPAKAASGKTGEAAAQAAAETAKATQSPPKAADVAVADKSAAPTPATATAPAAALILTEEVATEIWEAIAPGHVVLMADHVDGVFEGWWPAKVLSRAGNQVSLNWLGYESLGTFTKPITQLALMHPIHKD